MANKEHELYIKEILDSIRKLIRIVYLDSSKVSKEFGLTAPQSSVLRILVREGPYSSADLSRKLYVTPSNITGIIDRLENKGLVKRIRKPGDRRISLITMTEMGESLSKSLKDPIEMKIISNLTNLESKSVQSLSLAIKQIINLIDTRTPD
jgi:DNA-binding MarR family transcriptional regulator